MVLIKVFYEVTIYSKPGLTHSGMKKILGNFFYALDIKKVTLNDIDFRNIDSSICWLRTDPWP